jgi:hypothetical protein
MHQSWLTPGGRLRRGRGLLCRLTVSTFTLHGLVVRTPQPRTLNAARAVPLPRSAARRATPVMRQVGIMGFAHRWRGLRLRFALDFIDFSCNICHICNTAQQVVIGQ